MMLIFILTLWNNGMMLLEEEPEIDKTHLSMQIHPFGLNNLPLCQNLSPEFKKL